MEKLEIIKTVVFGLFMNAFCIIFLWKFIAWMRRSKGISNGRWNDGIQSKGDLAEKMVIENLRSIFSRKYIVRSVYLPTKDSITEVDVVMIHRTGIYFIEVKNYGGEIYGNYQDKYWEHYADGELIKEFYNPIMQNQGHIYWFNVATEGRYKGIVKNIIVFRDLRSLHTDVYNSNRLILTDIDSCKSIEAFKEEPLLLNREMKELYKYFKKCARVSRKEKAEHLRNVSQKSSEY